MVVLNVAKISLFHKNFNYFILNFIQFFLSPDNQNQQQGNKTDLLKLILSRSLNL